MLALHKLVSGMYSASRSLTEQLGEFFVFVFNSKIPLCALGYFGVCVYADLTGSVVPALLLLEVVVFSF